MVVFFHLAVVGASRCLPENVIRCEEMAGSIHYLHVQITRFARDDNPGWVACEFFDADNRSHTFEEKAPVVSLEYLDEASEYPRPGIIACTVLTSWQERKGRDLVRINTDIPWGIESAEGLSEFVVLSTQLEADGT
jgi:hypothetical protein